MPIQNRKEHLNFNLEFLGDGGADGNPMPKPDKAQTEASSGGDANLSTALVFGGLLLLIGLVWMTNRNDSSRQQPLPGTFARQSPAPKTGLTLLEPPAAPTLPPIHLGSAPSAPFPETSSGDMVSADGGQYACKRNVVTVLDGMEPKGKEEIDLEQAALSRGKADLDNLKFQMSLRGVTPYSDQHEIDAYNALVAKYNARLASLKSDFSAHEAHIDAYNKQVDARNDYLIAHCTRNW